MSATLPAVSAAPPRAAPPTARVASIDLIRGTAMILMAIDHVRVFAGVPAGGPDPALFFTRWVTHFCAPAFVFLAGTSAYLQQRKRDGLSRHLLIRGAWLILLELTVLRAAWTFNLDLAHAMAGVIWVIGWCMVLMAGLVRLPIAAVATIGLVILGAHDLLDPHLRALVASAATSPLGGLWKVLYVGFFAGPIQLGADGPRLIVLYSIVPWIGVMAVGYAFGRILTLAPARRDRLCLALGLGATALFLVLRGFDLYGDPRPWRAVAQGPNAPPPMPELLAFLNLSKYPASLSFLLMTLGPTIAAIPAAERARGALARAIGVFGRVPFFFYLLHLPLIHLLALLVSRIRLGEVSPWLFTNHPMGNPAPPDGYVWSLPLLYAVWAAAIVLLWFPCRWFAELKARRRDWWLSYL